MRQVFPPEFLVVLGAQAGVGCRVLQEQGPVFKILLTDKYDLSGGIPVAAHKTKEGT